MKESLVLIGGGGHCKSCIDVIESENRFQIAGILDLPERQGQEISGYPVIGVDADIPELAKIHRYFFITMGHIQSPDFRIKMYSYLKKKGIQIPVIISPSAYVSSKASIGEGTIIMHQAMVNTEAIVGVNCILNSGSLIEHEASVGNHCHISTKAILNGQCSVGSGCFVGSNTVLANNVDIEDDTLISAGSVVLRSLTKSGTYIGNPLRKIR